jgi:hypothetical protein
MSAESSRRKVAFIGQANYFDFVALSSPTPTIDPTFINFAAGGPVDDFLDEIDQFDPDVVIVFGPQCIPAGALADVKAIRIGWFTEPIALITSLPEWHQRSEQTFDKTPAQADLERRLLHASSCDVNQFDRLISHDPLQTPTLELFGPIWRSVPLAVDDRFFRDPSSMEGTPTIGFIGRSTPYREEFLTTLKHDYDLRHFAHGLFGERLLNELTELDIAVNLHNLEISTFENRVPLHLAQGHLVLSQPLTPTHGLEANRDFIEFSNPEELAHVVSEIFRFPDAQELIRNRGRQKAEYFRASVVYEKILRDLRLEHVF